MVLVDSRARMNVVTPEFVKARGLAAGSIQDLNNHAGRISINGAGGKCTEPLGYIMIQVQIPYAPSYDEDQVALIVEDPSLFSQRCPVILGTQTIFQAVQAMKESKMNRVVWSRPGNMRKQDRIHPLLDECGGIPRRLFFSH